MGEDESGAGCGKAWKRRKAREGEGRVLVLD